MFQLKSHDSLEEKKDKSMTGPCVCWRDWDCRDDRKRKRIGSKCQEAANPSPVLPFVLSVVTSKHRSKQFKQSDSQRFVLIFEFTSTTSLNLLGGMELNWMMQVLIAKVIDSIFFSPPKKQA